MEEKKDWIQTYTKRKFFPLAPSIDDISIDDIAHALSMQCRFSGHTLFHYSVAQHSVYVSYLAGPENALQGLLHDASEAYLVDIPRPLKKSGKFDSYLEYEDVLQKMIYKKYNCNQIESPSVKEADMRMLATEARDLMSPFHPEWVNVYAPVPFTILKMSPFQAEELFLERFCELAKDRE